MECLSWHRAWKHVASDDDMIYTGSTNFLEHSFERGKIPVNVVDSRQPVHRHFLR